MKLGVKEYMDTCGRDLSTHAVFKANLAWEIQQAHSGKGQSKQSYLSVKGNDTFRQKNLFLHIILRGKRVDSKH